MWFRSSTPLFISIINSEVTTYFIPGPTFNARPSPGLPFFKAKIFRVWMERCAPDMEGSYKYIK
jgi:hypothetical protein